MKTQNQRLLEYLQDGNRIDPLSAWSILGIYRLGARVFDLRRAGHYIVDETKVVQNRFGEKCRVALYRLVKEAA